MGKHIGSLGRKRQPLDLEFDYFGQTIRVNPSATDAVELEFIEAGKDIDMAGIEDLDLSKAETLSDEDQARLLAKASQAQVEMYKATMRSLRDLIHPDDFEAYWRQGRKNGQRIRDMWLDIRAITEAVLEETTDFPTGQRSGSGDGQSATSGWSEVASPSPDLLANSDLVAALAINRGRPDLQEFYVMEHENRVQAEMEERDRERRDHGKLVAAGLASG